MYFLVGQRNKYVLLILIWNIVIIGRYSLMACTNYSEQI